MNYKIAIVVDIRQIGRNKMLLKCDYDVMLQVPFLTLRFKHIHSNSLNILQTRNL